MSAKKTEPKPTSTIWCACNSANLEDATVEAICSAFADGVSEIFLVDDGQTFAKIVKL